MKAEIWREGDRKYLRQEFQHKVELYYLIRKQLDGVAVLTQNQRDNAWQEIDRLLDCLSELNRLDAADAPSAT